MRLKQLREENGLSQAALAKIINVETEDIIRWENNVDTPPITVLKKLTKFFECSTEYLLEIPDPPTEPKADSTVENIPTVSTEGMKEAPSITVQETADDDCMSAPPKTSAAKSNFLNILPIFIFILVFFAVGGTIFGVYYYNTNPTGCAGSTEKHPSRYATNSDIVVDSSSSLTEYKILIRPNCDIDNLTLGISFYDKNEKFIDSKTKLIGNVKEGREYTVYINYDSALLLKAAYVSVDIYDGTVYY